MRSCIVLLIVAASMSPALASDEKPVTLRFGGFYTDTNGERFKKGGGDPVDLSFENGFGARLGFERRLRPGAGFALDVGWSRITVNDAAPGSGRTPLDTFYLAAILTLHPAPGRTWDPYLGFGIAFANHAGSRPFDTGESGIAGLFRAGADIELGEPGAWRLNLEATFMPIEVEGTDRLGRTRELDIDPFMVGLGLSYRF